MAVDRREMRGMPTPPVLRSKVTVPSALTDLVGRVDVAGSVLESTAPVVVLVAPAGYGKTTVLCEVASSVANVAWVNVDSGDNDPVRFWVHVAAALGDAGVDVADLRSSLRFGHAQAVDQVIAAVESAADPLVLVLDDVHELVEGAVVEECAQLVSRLSNTMRLIAGSRNELDWPIARLRARGELIEVGAEHLSMRGDDGLRVLQPEIDAGLIDEESARVVVQRVDGWPAGLRLAKLALGSGQRPADLATLVGGDEPSVARYLAGEVLGARSADEQEFLVTSSVLDELTPGACDAVTGIVGSLGVLRSLVADRVFTVLADPSGPTFVYHRLLREFLQSQLAEHGEAEVARYHSRALDYFVTTADTGAVVRHAVAAGRAEAAMDRLGNEFIGLANDGRIEEMWRWVGMIGPEQVLAHPVLSSAPAWASLNLGRYDEIEPWLESFEMLDGVAEQDRLNFRLHGTALRCHRDRHLGLLDRAIESAEGVMADVDRASGLIPGPTALAAAGAALALGGRGAQADEVLRRAIAEGAAVGEPSSVVVGYGYLAFVTDDPVDALAHADSALAMVAAPELERFHLPATAWLVRGRCSQTAGRVADARDELDRALMLAEVGREPLVEVLILMQQARLHHLVGDDDSRREALRAGERILERTTGTAWLHEQLKATGAATRFAPTNDAHLPVGARELTDREMDVLRLLPFDLTRRELATQLFVSENTVKTHLTSIRHKLLVSARRDIVVRARELGLLDQPSG